MPRNGSTRPFKMHNYRYGKRSITAHARSRHAYTAQHPVHATTPQPEGCMISLRVRQRAGSYRSKYV